MANTDYYNIPSKLHHPILNYLVGLVLRSYGEEQKAQTFFVKAGEGMGRRDLIHKELEK